MTVGSRGTADLQVSGSNIAEEHAEIFQKGGRAYCRALAGDEEDVTSCSYTWLDGSESALRTGVLHAYQPVSSEVSPAHALYRFRMITIKVHTFLVTLQILRISRDDGRCLQHVHGSTC